MRRSDQSHRAWLPDVAGVPGLWPECETAQQPNGKRKLEQGTRDALSSQVVVAITHKKKSPTVQATVHLRDLVALYRKTRTRSGIAVTMDLDDFLDLYDFAELDDAPVAVYVDKGDDVRHELRSV